MKLQKSAIFLLILPALLIALLGGPDPVLGATFTVNSTADLVDANPGNGVCATSTGDLDITRGMTIAGAGAASTISATTLPWHISCCLILMKSPREGFWRG